ncbi:flagellar basal body-associated protein FliL [Kosakonia sp. SOY2]|uniref:flagellar basal body-associated protein FliL n=1 Tax=Kosakonia sp. SOY2 TaxID=3014557 RepID=UPI0022AC3E03|nr:flagellar basal body-associated protein FliL [Kosakonia sp. SOY2]MCZ3383833.1 flagellar basal body-associated protein FliL [Kosakonia sp. SOY2]
MPKKKQAAQSGKKSPLLALLILLILVGMCAGGAYAYMEINKLKTQVANGSDGKKPAEEVEQAEPVYLDLDTFTVSLKPDAQENDRILYIGLTLKVNDTAAKAMLEKHLPEVRSNLLVLFSQQTAAELVDDKAKETLALKTKDAVNASLAGQPQPMVTNVLFNAFILR